MSRSVSSGSDTYTKKLYFDPKADEPEEDGYWITDEELRQKLTNLVDVSENIDQVMYYSNPLYSWQMSNALLHHAFIVFKTENWWWSIEKNNEGVTIQRSKKLESVRDMYRRAKRTTGKTSLTDIILVKKSNGYTKINELINYLWRKDYLNQEYGVLSYNCQHFADLIFRRISESKNLRELDVYFDSAADQPSGLSGAGFITVDELISRVYDLSSIETLVKIEIYKAPINSLQIMDNFLHHLFVIFHTNQDTYWSIERWPTRFTMQKAKNKDILVNECERNPRPGNWFTPVRIYQSASAKKMTLSSVMDFIWKKDKLNELYDPISNNSKHFATSVYNQFQDGYQIK
jgi:hypothetical protein